MKRTMILHAAVLMVMMTMSVNTYAQRRGVVGQGRRGDHREMVFHDNGRMQMNHHDAHHADVRGNAMHHQGDYIHDGHGRYFRHDGFLPGYEGRVRYIDGRYGYLRAGRWYWYDTYFDPVYYYDRPLHCFRAHILNPKARKAVAGIAAGVAVGTLVANLVR